MKYGILTFHNIPNIGALLQAIGLCNSIRSLGVDCNIIDYECENIVKRELKCQHHRNPVKNIIIKLLWYKTERKIKSCNSYMKSLRLYSDQRYDKNTIGLANQLYDGFISGSDMIWNLRVTGGDFTYLQDFVNDGKTQLSYGSSIGERWNDEDLPKIKQFLSRYEHLSARESDTCEIVNSLGFKCKHVCDPTMLVDHSYWLSLAISPKVDNYVLVYFNSRELMCAAKRYAKRYGLKVVLISDMPFTTVKTVFPNNPPEWLGYFANASAVFTNSYHGLLFSLYFNKPVWSANYGNRIISLTEKLGLNNILLKNDSSLQYIIDYEKCNKTIEKLRLESLSYLENVIKHKV